MTTTDLSSLKAGDEVALQQGVSETYTILKIREITGRGIIILDNGEKYRQNGTPMATGSKWHRPANIEPVTQRIRDVNRHTRLANKLNALDINDWKKMDLATLEAVYALVKEYKQ